LAVIDKVEGNKVTYRKATFHRDRGSKYSYAEPVTVEAAKGVSVTMGHFLPAKEDRTTSDGRITGKTAPVKDGLGNALFQKLSARQKPIRPSLSTVDDEGADKGKITAINLWKSAAPKKGSNRLAVDRSAPAHSVVLAEVLPLDNSGPLAGLSSGGRRDETVATLAALGGRTRPASPPTPATPSSVPASGAGPRPKETQGRRQRELAGVSARRIVLLRAKGG
jgi:hypothetical protein